MRACVPAISNRKVRFHSMKMRGDQHPLVNPCVQTKGASSTIFLNDTHRESRSLKVANQASWTATQTTSINDESYKVAGPEIDRLVLMDVGLACSDGWRIYFEALAAKKRTGFENRSVSRHVCFTKIAKRKQFTNSPNSPTKYQHKSGVGIHLLLSVNLI